MPSRAVSTRSRTSCKGRFIPGAQEGWRPCCSRTTAPETGPSPFLAVLSNGEGRCRGEARCTWKTLPGSGRGTRKTASGGAAWGAGPSCGSYAHCGFDAHDLRRGQQTRRPITLPDNRADARPSGSVHGYREIAAGAPRSPHRFPSSPYRGFDRAGNYSLEQGLPTFDGQKDTFRRPEPDWSTDPVKPWRNSPILVRPCKR